MLKYLCFCLFCSASLAAYAQQPIKGRVLEEKTRIGLVNIHVQNLSSKQTTTTDNKGKFTINAKLNDLLVFTGFAYQADTLMLVKLNEFELFMLPEEHLLKDVQVKSIDGPSLVFDDPYFHGQTTAYQTDKAGNFKGGVAFRVWYWKKDERKRKRNETMLRNEKIRNQIAQAFNAKNVGNYLPLKGAELDNFIKLYTPSIGQYLDNNFVMADYLNTYYKKFMKLSLQKRLASPDSVLAQ